MTGPSISQPGPALELRRVSASYGGARVIHALDLEILRGRVHALIGPNGAGKSTVARLACGLHPLSGQAAVDGRPVGQAKIGFSPQDCALFPALTARENVEVMARLGGVSRRSAPAAVDLALRRAGCQSRADQQIRRLSGGWRRRANLAAALVGAPPLIVADEPTEGVDVSTRAVLGQALREAAHEGAGCLVISHDAEFVADVADTVSVMVKGVIVTSGAPIELLKRAFGQSRLVTVRLPAPPDQDRQAQLVDFGFTERPGGLEWTATSPDALELMSRTAPLVDAVGGEMSVRRPTLDQLVAEYSDVAP